MKAFITIIFLCIVSISYSQSNMWTWVKGDSISNSPAHWGTQGVSNVNNTPGPRTSSAKWTDSSGNLWLFGGYGYNSMGNSGLFNDLWKYNPSTNEWTWIKGDTILYEMGVYGTQGVPAAANNPGARTSSVTWTDASGNLWLFGGIGVISSVGGDYFNDIWKYDPITNEWTWIKGDNTTNQTGVYGTQGVSSTNNNPGGRAGSTGWTDVAGNLWLFGGSAYLFNGTDYRNDLWRYSISTNQWTWIKGDSTANKLGVYGSAGIAAATNKPGARGIAMGWTDHSGNFWLFGGVYLPAASNNTAYLNDLWQYNASSNQWIWMKGDSTAYQWGMYGTQGVAAAANKPGARGDAASWTDTSGNLWLFGGLSENANVGFSGRFNDLWKYAPSSNEWTWMRGDTIINQWGIYGAQGVPADINRPGARQGVISWTDVSGNMWLFGGYGYGSVGTPDNVLNDLWRFSPSTSLPLHLIIFTAHNEEKKVRLYWTSENEQNFSHYEVERSADSREWKKMQNVKCKMQNGRNEYGYDDVINGALRQVQGDNGWVLYYRLKMVDNDGKYSYSNVVEIRMPSSNSFSIYPNPASTSVQLQFGKNVNGRAQVEVRDMSGKVVMSDELRVMSGIAILETSKLMAGSYVVRVMIGGEVYTQKLVVSK